MERLRAVESSAGIPEAYRGTPIADMLEYHNLARPYQAYTNARLLIGMCMDNRKHLHIPDNFAYIIRSGGANLRYSEFKVSYAIGVGGVEAIALVGHDQCGMVNLVARKQLFVDGLVAHAGWTQQAAEEHFNTFAPMFELSNEVDFILSEVQRLRSRYPAILVAPMIYRMEDNRLYLIREN